MKSEKIRGERVTKEEQIEKQLLEYHVLTQRLDAISKSAEKDTLKKIALSLGPSDNTVRDITQPRTQSQTLQSWLYNFDRACELLMKQQEHMDDEVVEILNKRASIRLMVDNARLTEQEKLYCELRYYQGIQLEDIAEEGLMDAKKTKLKDIRKDALKKISEGNK